MNTHLEKYLKQATKGVWGKKKLEIITELRGSIESRIWMLEQQGHSNSEALKLALEEFGKPNEINAGLVTVHSMPKMFKAMVVAAMLSSLAVMHTNFSAAQVAGVAELPISDCSVAKNPEEISLSWMQKQDKSTICTGFWFKIGDLQSVLEPLGVTYSRQPSILSKVPDHVFTFPGNNFLIIHPASTVKLGDETFPQLKTNEESDAEYIPGSSLFSASSAMNLPTNIQGFDFPKISIGSTTFTFGTTEDPIDGREFYAQVFQKYLMNQYFPVDFPNEEIFLSSQRMNDTSQVSRYLKIKHSKPDEVYVMLYRDSGDFDYGSGKIVRTNYRVLDFSPVYKTGYLIFRTPIEQFEFIANPKNVDRIGNNKNEKFKVVLMRFTGKLNTNAKSFEVVPADQIEIVKHPGR